MDFNCKHLHFIGIGGVSMGALAKICELDGAKVTGSDNRGFGGRSSPRRKGHHRDNIHSGIDLVIINGAISESNVELKRARELGIPVMDRSEILAEIEGRYPVRIAVAGCHGKSTTVAMIGAVLCAGGLDPTIHNGARPNLRLGGREIFLTEACEFRRSFLKLSPTIAVITNVELDHVDCYRDLGEIQKAFEEFASKAAICVRHDESDVFVPLQVAGAHNAMNAALAVKVGLHFGIDMETIRRALWEFRGIERRFEHVGDIVLKVSGGCGTCAIISDYAHHPTEIATTIATADERFGRGNYLIVFQPHTFTRTRALFGDFVEALGGVDCVLYRTFAAREKPMRGGRAEDLARALGVRCFASARGVRRFVRHAAGRYKAVVLTGAGDVNEVLGGHASKPLLGAGDVNEVLGNPPAAGAPPPLRKGEDFGTKELIFFFFDLR